VCSFFSSASPQSAKPCGHGETRTLRSRPLSARVVSCPANMTSGWALLGAKTHAYTLLEPTTCPPAATAGGAAGSQVRRERQPGRAADGDQDAADHHDGGALPRARRLPRAGQRRMLEWPIPAYQSCSVLHVELLRSIVKGVVPPTVYASSAWCSNPRAVLHAMLLAYHRNENGNDLTSTRSAAAFGLSSSSQKICSQSLPCCCHRPCGRCSTWPSAATHRTSSAPPATRCCRCSTRSSRT